MKRIRRTALEAEIPTSSMADIAFLLIIFFMVTAVFAATKGLEVRLPPPDDRQPDPDPGVLVHVTPRGLFVDCRPMGLNDITSYLAPRLAADPNKPVILYTEPDAAYERFVAVYDVLAGASAENIAVPTASEIEAYTETFGINPFEAACPSRTGTIPARTWPAARPTTT